MAEKKNLGVGCDVGTMNLVSARRTGKGVSTRRVRDAFLDLDMEAKKMLKLSGVHHVEHKGELIVIGDAALEMANVFGRDARRPLSAGLIAPGELDALDVLGILVKDVLQKPKEEGEFCYFSVPAAPVDDPTKDVVYHQGIFERIITECGYTAEASNEAMAIVFSEAAAEGFSALSLSFGAGMVNVALAINAMEAMTFSVSRSGDWIDTGAAKAVGTTASRITAIKEKGIDLQAPTTREEEAIALYYKSLIEYCIKHIRQEFKKVENKFSLPKAIPLIVSGGTSQAGNFVPFFTEVFERRNKNFPIEISEIRHAKDPLNAVARGLLVQASQEYDDE